MNKMDNVTGARRTGRLTKEKFGFSMPVDAPAYKKPPAALLDLESITITYETDMDAALDMLPADENLELAHPTTAKMIFTRMPYTPWGAYNEVYQVIDCLWQGQPCIFPVRLLVDNEIALTIGRELWGNPKKFGFIEFSHESNIIQCIGERPRGNRICTGLIQLDTPIEVEPTTMDVLGLRVIPNPENIDEFSIAELLMNTLTIRPKQAWTGSGSLMFNVMSELDPWYKLPVRKLVSTVYSISDMETSPSARIIRKF